MTATDDRVDESPEPEPEAQPTSTIRSGRQLDRWFGTEPWLTAVFSLCGIAAGFVNLFRIAARTAREEELMKQEDDARDGGDDGGGN